MGRTSGRRGQALILIVFAIVGLVGLTALAVDGGATYQDRQSSQTSADSAALSAALRLAKGLSDWSSTALSVASSNGYNNDGTNNTVTVSNPPGADCSGNTTSYTNPSQYVQVKIVSKVKTSFAPVVGIRQTNNCVVAVARAVSGGSSAMFGGAAIIATKQTGDSTMLFNGSAYVKTDHAGVFDNSSGTNAMLLNGGVSLIMDSPALDVGGVLKNGSVTVTPSITTNYTPQLSMPMSEWSSIPAIPTAPTCSGSGGASGYNGSFSSGTLNMNSGNATLTPGNFSGINVNGGTLNFSPGTYCISGSLNMNGGAMAGSGGTVKIVMNNGVTMNGGITGNFADLEIYTTNGNWILNGGASLTATRLRFYSTGSSTFVVNGSATLVSSNCFFYLTSGNVTWNGSSNITLAGPPDGDPYKGLLIYMPWTNTSSFILNGGSTVNVTGTILAPHSNITANGGSSFHAYNSQIIGYTFIFNGGGTFEVNFDASVNYGAASASTVQLIK